MKWHCRNNRTGILAACTGLILVLACPVPGTAQSITQVEPFRFGTFAIVNSGLEARITIQTDGSYNHNSNVAMLDTTPQPGEYTISGPANQSYSLTLPPSVNL